MQRLSVRGPGVWRRRAAGLAAALSLACGGGGAPTAPPPAPPDEDFALILVPDTQCYPSLGSPTSCGGRGTMEMFFAEVNWIAAEAAGLKLRAIVGVGDIVDCASRTQYDRAASAYDVIDTLGVPYVPVVGNHDYGTPDLPHCGAGHLPARMAQMYNEYFGPTRLFAKPWYGAGFPSSSNENFYVTFEAAGRKYLVLALEFYPRESAVTWAHGIVRQFADREVIVTTHSYLNQQGLRVTAEERDGPLTYGLRNDYSGERLWTDFVSHHPNVIAVVSGHMNGRSSYRIDPGRAGNQVVQIFTNFQAEGGNGWLRILRIHPARRSITSTVYSPYLNQFRNGPSEAFAVTYGLGTP